MTSTESKDRQFVNALARGLEILRAFAPGDAKLGNQELAKRTGLPKPTVSRFTKTLTELQYLTADPRSGGFALGPGVLSLGYAALANMELTERAAPYLIALAETPGAVAVLLAPDREEATCLMAQRQTRPVSVSVSVAVGARFPFAASAGGRAIMAGLSAKARREKLAALRPEKPDAAFQAQVEAIERAAEEYRRLGYCTHFGDWLPDVIAVAAPVFNDDGGQVFAIGVGAPAFLAPAQAWSAEFGPRVAEAASALSRPPPRPPSVSSRKSGCVEAAAPVKRNKRR